MKVGLDVIHSRQHNKRLTFAGYLAWDIYGLDPHSMDKHNQGIHVPGHA
jgi:hypothetical protein